MKKKLAFIGVGLRTFTFLEGIKKAQNECELVALCDLYPARMQFVIRKYGLHHVRTYTDYRVCMVESGCDAAMIFTPDGAHLEPAVAALRAGLHVFLEKPLEITRERCRTIIETDRAVGGKTYVGFNLRHAPVYRKLRELIEAGVAGGLLTIQADEFYDGGRTYFRRWNRLVAKSGGLWISKASHDFDILQWLAGAKPLSVQAQSALTHYVQKPEAGRYCRECPIEQDCPDSYTRYKFLYPEINDFLEAAVAEGFPRPDLCLYNSDKDTFDHGMATVRFEGDLLATYTVNVVAGFTNRRIRVSGTKATLDGDLTTQEVVIRHRDPARKERLVVAEDTDGHGGADRFMLPDFLAFTRGERLPPVNTKEALLAVLMGLAARESCERGGEPVNLSD
jgi:predicted dehydrogenase